MKRMITLFAVVSTAVMIMVTGMGCVESLQEQSTIPAQGGETALVEEQIGPLWTGEGGKGIRLAVLEPSGEGLSEDDQWVLPLVQGSITGDFNKFSGMTIIDRQNLEKVIAEQIEHTSGKYSDEDAVKIGNLTNASHILTGSITRTPNRFIMIEFSITELESSVRKASYSPKQVSFRALENLSAVKVASADLLAQLGVELTSAGLAALKRVENTAIQGQVALARGITAQRHGTEVAALSYFFQATALDTTLLEAANRSQTLSVNISSGNIGDNARNAIQWRKDWIDRLTETEIAFSRMIDASDPPYRLYYSTGIKSGEIDYKTETTSFSFPVNLHADKLWFSSIQKAVRVVYNGLTATGKKKEWDLEHWPLRGLSDVNPFDRERYSIAVVFELVNEHGKVISKQTANIRSSYRFSPKAEYSENTFETVTFNAVNANDISDALTIRVASVNKTDPEYARIQITALSDEMWQTYSNISNYFVINKSDVFLDVDGIPFLKNKGNVVGGVKKSALDIECTKYGGGGCWVNGFSPKFSQSQFLQYGNLILHTEIWDETFINVIGYKAFSSEVRGNFDGVQSYYTPRLAGLTIIGDGVTIIGASAFYGQQLSSVTIPNSVTVIGREAFYNQMSIGGKLSGVIIGANVRLGKNAIGRGFEQFYQNNGRRAGTYTYDKESKTWSYSQSQDASNLVGSSRESSPPSSRGGYRR
jgi:hypothetical protein